MKCWVAVVWWSSWAAVGCGQADTESLLRRPTPRGADAGETADVERAVLRRDAESPLDAQQPDPAEPDAALPEPELVYGERCPANEQRASVRTEIRICLPPAPPDGTEERLDPTRLDLDGLLLTCGEAPIPTEARISLPHCVSLVPAVELPELTRCELAGAGSVRTTRGRTMVVGASSFGTAPRVLFRLSAPLTNPQFESYWLDEGLSAPAVSVAGHSLEDAFGASRIGDDEAELEWSTTTTPAAPVNRDGLGVAEAAGTIRAVWASRPSGDSELTDVWLAHWPLGADGFDPGTQIVARTASITHRFPQVVHDGAHRVAVSWIQLCRTPPCDDDQLGTFLMTSRDGGRTFDTPSRVGALPSRLARVPVLWLSSRGPLLIRRIASTVSGVPAELELALIDRLDVPLARFAWDDETTTLLPLPGDRIMVVGRTHLALVAPDGSVTTRAIEDGHSAQLKPNGELVRFTTEGYVRVSSDLGQTFRRVGVLQRNAETFDDDSIATWVGDNRILYLDRRTHTFATPSLYPGERCDDYGR